MVILLLWMLGEPDMPTQGLSNKTLGYLGEREKESLRKEGMALTSLAYLQKKKKNVYVIFTEEPFPLKHGIENRRADLLKLIC